MVEKNLNNTAHAIGKSIKSSQQKANLVLRSIRGLPVENAVNVLQFSRRRISNIILKFLTLLYPMLRIIISLILTDFM